MYSVYKITNLINGKCYIGSSIRPEKRWREHINTSKRPNDYKYNYPLYKAFRKYGINNFVFEIINDDFESIEEMQQYEQRMIICFNSLQNGYNQTINTNSNNIANENIQKYINKISCKCAKIDKNNNIIEKYKSYHEAARKNNLDADNYASKIRNVCKGISSSINNEFLFRDLDSNENIIQKPFKSYKRKKAIIGLKIDEPDKELYFSSISEAAKAIQCDRGSISKCIAGDSRYSIVKGYIFREIDIFGNIVETDITIDERISEYNEHNPVINGVRHSINDWCKIYNISKNTFYNRKKQGMTSEEAIITPKRR